MTRRLIPWRIAKLLAHPLVVFGSFCVALAAYLWWEQLGNTVGATLGALFVILIHWHPTYIILYIANPGHLTRIIGWSLYAFAILTGGLSLVWQDLNVVAAFDVAGTVTLYIQAIFASGAMKRAIGPRRVASRIILFLMVGHAAFLSALYFWRIHDRYGRPIAGWSPSPFAPVVSYPAPTQDRSAEYRAFWKRFQEAAGETAEAPRMVDAFGDSPEMHDELLALVLNGTKKATASLARWYTEDELPRVGDLALITDGSGKPRCVIRTTQVDIIPVREVDADFAYAEGEGDRSHEYWITEHRKFWQREAAREGFEYSDDLDVVCERFELVWAG